MEVQPYIRFNFYLTSSLGSSDANEAVQISLVQPGPSTDLKILHQFKPRFTYPVFGEEERIFGYKGLEIHLRFAAHDLRPNVMTSYEKRFKPVGDTVALDINKTLRQWMPACLTQEAAAFAKATEFEKFIQNDTSGKVYQPPGRLVHTYTRNGMSFEIWAGSLLDKAVREMVDRMQIFISMFIEGGTPLNLDDMDWTIERWMVYFIFEKASATTKATASPYALVGYATTYRFYTFRSQKKKQTSQPSLLSTFPEIENISATKLPSRIRISQFLILPPHQHAGHGSALYNTVYSECISDITVSEMTVEDPSEDFDILRDANDWKVLELKFRAANICINTSPFPDKRRYSRLPTAILLPLEKLGVIRSETKIAGRQFARQLEMYLLSLIPFSHRAAGGASLTKLLVQKSKGKDPHDRSYYWWRMILKQRIYKKNKDILQQLEVEERLLKVEESVRAQEDEYEKLLLLYAAQAEKKNPQNGNAVSDGGGGPSKERKRRLIVDEDEELEDEGGAETGGEPSLKKTRTVA